MWPIEKSVLLYMTDKRFEHALERLKLAGISDTYKIFLRISQQKMGKKKYINFYNQSFSILLKNGKLPVPEKYPLVEWIIENRNAYRFVYATGGQRLEALYVLKSLGVAKYFDFEYSVDKTVCRFSKKTGLPFRKIKSKWNDCMLVSDSEADGRGATLTRIPFILVKPRQNHFDLDW